MEKYNLNSFPWDNYIYIYIYIHLGVTFLLLTTKLVFMDREMLIFLWDYIYIYIYRSYIYRYVQKLSRLKMYLPRQKWIMNEMLISFQIVPMAFNTYIPAKHFQLWNSFFWYDVKVLHHVCWYAHVLHDVCWYALLCLRWIFSLRNKKKLNGTLSLLCKEVCSYIIQFCTENCNI